MGEGQNGRGTKPNRLFALLARVLSLNCKGGHGHIDRKDISGDSTGAEQPTRIALRIAARVHV